MSIAPALLAIQLSTMTANGSFRGMGGGWIVNRWSELSGWRSFLFGVAFILLCGVITLALMGVVALTIGVMVWFSSMVPLWLAIVGCIAIGALGIAICFGLLALLYR
jgi:hypothetical protein